MNHDERRDTPRHFGQHDVLIKVLGDDVTSAIDGRIYTCATADVSESGLRLSSSIPFAVNACLDLRLRASADQFVLSGRVRWSSFDDGVHMVGIRFEPTEGDDTEAWRDWSEGR